MSNCLIYDDTLHSIASHLTVTDVAQMSCVCSRWNKSLKEKLTKLGQAILTQKYGTFCPSETDITTLLQTIKNLEQKNCLEYFNAQGISIAPKEPSYCYLFENIRKNYELFCGNTVKTAAQATKALVTQQREITQELQKNSPTCLQDIIEQGKRLSLFTRQQKNLHSSFEKISQNQKTFVKKLPLLEKLAFRIISFVRQEQFHPSDFLSPVPTISVDSTDFLKPSITVGETGTVFNGTSIPLLITAQIHKLDENNQTIHRIFCLMNKDTNSVIGRITIEKGVKAISNDLYLHVKTIEDHLGYDASLGDFPVKRLLLQLLIEIFIQENINHLSIEAQDSVFVICLAAGMHCYRADLKEEIVEEIKKARKDGKLFPQENSLGSHMTFFERTDLCYTEVDKQKISSFVDFELNRLPITWEEQIAKRPLLGKENRHTVIVPLV